MSVYAVIRIDGTDDLLEGMHLAEMLPNSIAVGVGMTLLIVSTTKPSVHPPSLATDEWRTRKSPGRERR